MARYPGAVWRPVTGHTNGAMDSYRGAVLHCNDADSTSLYGWIMSNKNGMSCHFQIFKDGTVEQYLDTAVSSWCQGGGNDDWISIETSGKAGVPLTDAQVDALVKLYAWLHQVHGIPLTLADTPSGKGFGWHGMAAAVGNTSWGHALCPGVRKDQRQTILNRIAGTQTNPADPAEDEEDDMRVGPWIGRRTGDPVVYVGDTVTKSAIPAPLQFSNKIDRLNRAGYVDPNSITPKNPKGSPYNTSLAAVEVLGDVDWMGVTVPWK